MRPRRDPTTRHDDARPADGGLVARVVDTADGRQCTLFPADVDDASRTTTWLTADEDGFVDLAAMR